VEWYAKRNSKLRLAISASCASCAEQEAFENAAFEACTTNPNDGLPMNSVSTRSVATGVAWMASARVVVRTLGLLSTLALARLLAPVDFGLVAMAMVVAGALELLTLFSFDVALIQLRNITREHYDSAWTLNLLMGIALASALVLSTPIAAEFYHEARLHWILPLIGLKYLVDNAVNTGTVDFRRELKFGQEFYLQVVPKIASVVITVPLALWLRDYRALIAGMLLSSAVGFLMSYAVHPHRPRWCLSEAAGLFRFSRWLLLNNLLNFLRTRSADLIVGRVLGATPLGVFALAIEVSNLPSTELVAPINRVLFPTYAKIAEDPDRLRRAFSASLGIIAMLILPVSVGLAALADPLVRVMLGDKWLDVISPLSMLALAGAATVLQTNPGSVYGAIGKPRAIALTQVVHVVTLIPMQIFAAYHGGLIAFAAAQLLHNLLFGITSTYVILIRMTPIRVSDVLGPTWRPLIACATMFVALGWLVPPAAQGDSLTGSLATLAIGSSVGAAIYLVVLYALWFVCGRPNGSEASALELIYRRRIVASPSE
jgi:lipopolysaccharide exporter